MPISRTNTLRRSAQGGLVLFFCLFSSFVFASTPTLGTITPSSGTTTPSVAKAFTCAYSDASGYAHLKETYLLISTSATALANSSYLYYNRSANLIYLRNDANTAWLGGYVPGSSSVIENSFVSLNCASTTVSGSANTLTVSFNVTFKLAYSGKAYNTYLSAKDINSATANFTKKGTYTVNSPPLLGAVTPATGTGQAGVSQTFTTTYTDPDGWQNIQYVYFLLNASTSGTNCAYLYYNQNTNLLYLRNDANSAWLGGYAPGSSNVIENSYVKLSCASTTISGSGSTLTLNWSITIKAPFTGVKNTYLYVQDDVNTYVSLTKKGIWTIPNQAPTVGTITPSAGNSIPNQTVSFTATYNDSDTWLNIRYGYLLINTSATGLNCFYAYYDRESNKLYLRNDANSSWVGGYAPSTSNVMENTYVKLNCAATAVSGSGSTMTITWSVMFKAAFNGKKNIYLYVTDYAGAKQGWVQKGTWTNDAAAPTGSISVNSGAQYSSSMYVTLNLSATDSESGMGTGSLMQFSNDNVNWSTPEIYSTSKAWTLSSGDGTKTVYVKFKDAAGNWSVPISAGITLDTTPPAIVITSPLDGAVVENTQIQLQGTVDGAAFSESRTLIEGSNTLTKDAADAAGNTATASISVYCYLGTAIGPQGGEVLSSDGTVKLVIPAGALSVSTQIKVLTVNKDTLQKAAPASTSLLSVVECKPTGLVFSKPVTLIYTLSQAQIPGTPVELGYYDSAQGKIIATGQTGIVPKDGYTVAFSVTHFSTYAALVNMVSQSTPIGSGVKIPLPDILTGAFGHAIPISVAPGRKGMQPALGLSYRSSNANSWVGLGFSLNPGFIVRSTRLGPPKYNDTQDTFYFITDAGTTELVNLIDNLYQAKVESGFTKFFKEPDDTWRVVGKDGGVLRFGQSTDSKEVATQGTFAWYLTKVIDTNGNYLEYYYTKDQGKSYLSRIDYTGNEAGLTPTNSVEFTLESRNDVPSSYISGSRIATAKRLKEIQVKVNSGLVWRYTLEYAYSADTKRSLLKTITQYGSDGKSLPQQKLEYQKAK